MLTTAPFVSSLDRQLLLDLADRALSSWTTYAPYLEFFRRRLRWSEGLPPEQVPLDMVTLYSRFEIEGDQGVQRLMLVPPHEADESVGKISVLSPMGVALYGARSGEEVCWIASTGPHTATVRAVIDQPERQRAA